MAKSISLLSYNMQAAIGTQRFSQYFTRAHHQFRHTAEKLDRLHQIAEQVEDYDIVCLQEVGLGGARSGFINQAEKLQSLSGHEYMSQQENRVIGNVSRHGNAVLSRLNLSSTVNLKLPGSRNSKIVGRGAIISKLADLGNTSLVNLHLSLDLRARRAQLASISEHIASDSPLILCGDFNCSGGAPGLAEFIERFDLRLLTGSDFKTYPTWKPKKDLDHILVSSHFDVTDISHPDINHSDHRPVMARLSLR
ncbi:endonuclease/exonuclease/phosphatase family protein [Hellea sp.]|nr:endonuclease/exonuclease/phosphatase family protein [Hellea sp.]